MQYHVEGYRAGHPARQPALPRRPLGPITDGETIDVLIVGAGPAGMMLAAEVGAIASIGTVGDSYDNALAESVVGLYKNECVKIDGPFRSADDLELATLSWVHWFNENRLHSSIGYLTPIEKENEYYREMNPQHQPVLGELALH